MGGLIILIGILAGTLLWSDLKYLYLDLNFYYIRFGFIGFPR